MKFPVHDTVWRSPAQDAGRQLPNLSAQKRDEAGKFASASGGGGAPKEEKQAKKPGPRAWRPSHFRAGSEGP